MLITGVLQGQNIQFGFSCVFSKAESSPESDKTGICILRTNRVFGVCVCVCVESRRSVSRKEDHHLVLLPEPDLALCLMLLAFATLRA